MEIIEATPEIIDAFAKSAREKCWPVLAEKIDSQWIKRALEMIVQKGWVMRKCHYPDFVDGLQLASFSGAFLWGCPAIREFL